MKNLDSPDFAMQYGRPLYQHWVKVVHYGDEKSCTGDVVKPAHKLFLCFHAQTTTSRAVICSYVLTMLVPTTDTSVLFFQFTNGMLSTHMSRHVTTMNSNFRVRWNASYFPLTMLLDNVTNAIPTLNFLWIPQSIQRQFHQRLFC